MLERGAGMFAHKPFPLSRRPTGATSEFRRARSRCQGSTPEGREQEGGAQRECDPGMFMKKLALSECSRNCDGIFDYPFFENKEVIVTDCRLSNKQKQYRKMKV